MFILLGLSFVSLYFCFYETQKKRIDNWIEAMVAWCVLLYIKTEVMSLFAGVNSVTSMLFWLFIIVLTIARVSYKGKWHIISNEVIIVIKNILHNEFLLLGGGYDRFGSSYCPVQLGFYDISFA